ncbi:hypothetical protein BH09SUM1_BH09SUM1_08760 [soil metagenome]
MPPQLQGLLCAIFLIAILAASREGWCDSVTLQQGVSGYAGTRDATIFSDQPSNSVGGFSYIFSGNIQFGGTRRALISFDLDGVLSPDAVVTTATLHLIVDRTKSASDVHELHRLLRDWGEGSVDAIGSGGSGAPAESGDATWTSAFLSTDLWTTAGGDFAPAASGSGPLGFTGSAGDIVGPGMVADITAWLADPSSNHGWILLGNETQSTTARRLCSSEFPTAASRPSLTIDFTTPPAETDLWMLR